MNMSLRLCLSLLRKIKEIRMLRNMTFHFYLSIVLHSSLLYFSFPQFSFDRIPNITKGHNSFNEFAISALNVLVFDISERSIDITDLDK